MTKTADFSRTCEGCPHVTTEPFATAAGPGVAFRCFHPGPQWGYVVGIDRPEPYVPAWCPKGDWA